MCPIPSASKKSRTKKKYRPRHENAAASAETQQLSLIAAIGASAGGMEAFNELLRNLPTNTGMAFILIQHLDPKHVSQLPGLLWKDTSMRVVEVADGMQVLPNQVFVIPPNRSMTISDHVPPGSPF